MEVDRGERSIMLCIVLARALLIDISLQNLQRLKYGKDLEPYMSINSPEVGPVEELEVFMATKNHLHFLKRSPG